MSDALLRHNWHLLVNPHWSPLYPFLISVANWLVRPSAYWELPIAHVVNLGIFLGALASFEFLLSQVICVVGRMDGRQDKSEAVPVQAWRWCLLGYSFFAWSTFVMIKGIRMVGPDLCVAAFVYLDAGLLLKARTDTRKLRPFLLLGLTLGLGYFAKAILFPMAFVFMAVALFLFGRWRKAVLPLAMTFLVFSAISAPQFISVSRMVGRPSFSESGNLNIVWQINGREMLPFYASRPPTDLKHPMNLLHYHPDVFGFEDSLASTYPPWRDPQYWNAGANTHLSPQRLLRAIARNLAVLLTSFYMASIWLLIAAGAVFYFRSPDLRWRVRQLVKSWPLLVPGIAGLTLYALVLIEPRYIAPFVVLILLGFFPAVLLRKSSGTARHSTIPTLLFAASVMIFTAVFIVFHLVVSLPVLRGHGGVHYQAAELLNRDGVRPGEAVAIIGSGWDGMIWARLARLRIVAQIPPEDANDFWRTSDPRAKADVYDALARTGARAVVTEETPPPSGFADWGKVGDTPYYVHFLAVSTDN